MSQNNSLIYCDNGKFDEKDDCLVCPRGSICRNGQIRNCASNFDLIQGQICIDRSKLSLLASQMLNWVLELSSLLNGHNLCQGTGELTRKPLLFPKHLGPVKTRVRPKWPVLRSTKTSKITVKIQIRPPVRLDEIRRLFDHQRSHSGPALPTSTGGLGPFAGFRRGSWLILFTLAGLAESNRRWRVFGSGE